MKNSKLKIEDFLSDSLNTKQTLNVLGGGEDFILSHPPKGTGTISSGGTGSGPTDPNPIHFDPTAGV
ncbi:hypothetical protein FLJC2902T_01680 [Flavobacterium limnosediminis JC2902]|uniref:Uncharacterized protein n=1 Tax=Flavobacterium limnosediminis JC2902 TaxID=1341181 RepID=V6SZ72_9FLAO|nr:hypothetical protein [Flavobacterium limnosediminis]ESU29695.1 hypothetical protein FLJC2902T_01680 [Flavobacterium limnosediminis JC2902]